MIMTQINLLPDVKKEFLKSQKTKALVISGSIIVTLVAVGLSALLYAYVVFAQQLQINLITDDIKNKSAELNNIQDISKYLTVQNQLQALPDLHSSKGVYSRLFAFLPVLNPSQPNNINLASLQIAAEDKTLSFSGTTASFESLNVFADTLSNAEVSYKPADADKATSEKMFKKVTVQSSGLSKVDNTTKVSFTVVVEYNEAMFNAKNANVEAKVPNIQTTPSVTGSPKLQLFDNQGGQ